MTGAGVADATSRLELRRRKDRRRRWLAWLVAVLGAGLIGAAVYLVGFSPVLAVARVTITGTEVASRKDVSAAAQVGLGTPLVRVDTAGVAERVAGLPPVAEVEVAREWPDGLRIAVTERVARLAVRSGTGYLVADATGVVFDTAKSLPKDLIRVDADPADRQRLVDAGTVYSALSERTAKKVEAIEARGRDSITLRLSGGQRVIWGSAEQSALKAEVIDALLPEGGRVFDVSAPSHPTRR
ncbi:MAG: FtsQ-type POTRA domain-containing protein [Propionicimonas sp.]|uniref:cell division protein FtsQ/DivIB n=1 Tax=Propionicimonas sp. TaxID=1955623 RepID=UPI002B205C85|nr:FtsQ-type POTRA domain-containing protein [Propionicimonas sp.]MEA4943005.1 FtsQ-type POTRA domain-containing protein [Propionicimonas sp.]MEA5053696.1 FtsQ-type POTRA domain-containing protein [Propionicimonas sp.]MEA5118849.1 FtsQ-type POTRA domain-containing protein [Propionicimonas sp.]